MTTIRRATAEDAPFIRQWVLRERLDPTSLNWQHFLMAEIDGQIVGFGQVKELPGCYELGSLIVLPGNRGRGIAGELIRALEESAPRPLYLMCEVSNCGLYEHFGYKRISPAAAPRVLRWKRRLARFLSAYRVQLWIMRKD